MPFKTLFLPLFFALIAGLLAACSYAPWHQPELALISILLLICVWYGAKSNQAFWLGLVFGIGEFSSGIGWVQISIHNFGNTSPLISFLITALFVLYLSLFKALTGYTWSKIRNPSHPVASYLVLLPSLWVLFDWLRGFLFSGFPWLFPGYSFIDTPLSGFAPLLGVYGLTWIGVCSVCAFFLLINQRKNLTVKRVTGYLAFWVIAWIGGFALTTVTWTTPSGSTEHVALVQGNIPFEEKWSVNGVEKTLQTYWSLTQGLLDNDVVIWPETAIPINQNDANVFLESLNALGNQTHTAIATGVLWQIANDQLFNAVIALGWQSRGVYLKRHLVPFGEYEPFPFVLDPIFKALSIPMSNLSAGPMSQRLLTLAGKPVAAFVCYEVAYPNLVIESSKKAEWLLVVSDDSWFGHSWASAQQLQMAQMRSLETGRDMAYATSNGITAFINNQGEVVKRAPLYTQTILKGILTPRSGLTPLSVYGPFSVIALFAIFVIIAVYRCTKSC
jgi:apolipoprotein N-acyltransferase